MVFGRSVTMPSRVSSMLSSRRSKGSTNFSIPSRRSVSVTSLRSIPASASASSSAPGSCPAVPAVTSSCSLHASRVGIGMVFTVWRPTSVATYLVSG